MFGTELVKGKSYEFMVGAKVAIFSFHGCLLVLKGNPDVCYVAKETPLVQYLNTHGALEQMRTSAEKNNTRGPIVMLVGPTGIFIFIFNNYFLNSVTMF